MSLSNFEENVILDYILEANLYFAACTADPTDAGTGASMNEVANSNSYARVAITAATWDAASGGNKANGAAIEFPEATGSWGTVTHWAIVDSGTYGAGNMIWHGALTASKAIASGQTLRIPVGSGVLSAD